MLFCNSKNLFQEIKYFWVPPYAKKRQESVSVIKDIDLYVLLKFFKMPNV